jgi:hypothetical protein
LSSIEPASPAPTISTRLHSLSTDRCRAASSRLWKRTAPLPSMARTAPKVTTDRGRVRSPMRSNAIAMLAMITPPPPMEPASTMRRASCTLA